MVITVLQLALGLVLGQPQWQRTIYLLIAQYLSSCNYSLAHKQPLFCFVSLHSLKEVPPSISHTDMSLPSEKKNNRPTFQTPLSHPFDRLEQYV